MRILFAAFLLVGLSAAPAPAPWDDEPTGPRRGTEDGGYGRGDRNGPRFRADDDGRGRDRRAFGRDDPDEIMPRRRDRDRDDGRRRDWDDRDRRDAEGRWRDDRSRSGGRYDPYDRYYGPSYGPPVAPAAPGGVFVVPPPIPGARRY